MPLDEPSGDQEVRHRSKGKGGQGIPIEHKVALSVLARDLRSFLSAAECQEFARKYIEWGESEAKRVQELRRNYGTKTYQDLRDRWYGPPQQRAEYFAKELRSNCH